ncbi:MAG: FkbM family methyltransferase [Betaproteobacteria bacterium]|nr:FkbM family methyltransferase [Betaproteobacteria bacterium]
MTKEKTPSSTAAPTSQIEPTGAQGLQHITTGFNTLSKCRHGWMLYHTADQYIGRGLKKYGEFSEGEVALFRQVLRPGHLVVEAGANFGAHTLAMAKIVGKQGCIIAFEPQRLVFQAMVANVALNSLTNVVTMQAGLGAYQGTIKVPVLNPAKGNNFGGFNISNLDAGEEVPVKTIDSLNLNRCRLIKVDVEGMECEVLEGARNAIARLRPVLYVENDRTEHSRRLIALIQSLGYKLWWHLPRMFNPDNFRGDKENLFGNIVSVNMLCLPQETQTVVEMPEIKTPDDDWRNVGKA